MTWNRLKKGIAGTALVFTFLVGSGAMLATTAQAQDRNRDRNWQRDRDDHHDRNRDWERRRQAERAREWEQQRERERLRNRPVYGYPSPRVYSSPRVYPYGGYGRNGGYNNGGYSSYDEQKGFRDGLDRGQEDVRDRRSPNPNNSEHFRNGNSAYRAGFRRGYEQGYRQYGGGYRRW